MILDGYVRVSQVRGREGERFISPSVQREQIERWCAGHQASISLLHEELDESGARADRPKLMAAVQRIEDRTIDGLVVAYLDRFGRSVLDGLALIKRIQDAGGSFVSVQEGFDISTDAGRQMLRTWLSNAEWQLDRIRATWDGARERAVARGMHIAAFPPVGYRRGKARRLTPDPKAAPVIAELFRRRAEGARMVDLQHFLQQAGARTALGNVVWRPQSVASVLRNRVYLGEIHVGKHMNLTAHDALVDEVLWQAAQRTRSVGPCYRNVRATPVGGLVRCASCSLVLNSGAANSVKPAAEYRGYHCPSVSGSGACPAPARIRGWELEHLMEEAFFTVARQRRPVQPDARKARQLAQAEQALAAYRDHPTLLSQLGPERFTAGVDVRLARIRRCALAVADDRARVTARSAERSAADWERAWPTLTVLERREAMASLLDGGFAARGEGDLGGRFWACRRGEGPHDLRKRLRTSRQPIPFEPNSHPVIALTAAPTWPARRVRQELSDYVSEMGQRWPAEQQFLLDGRGPLLRQIDHNGGQDAWARRVGVSWRRTTTRRGYWTEPRVRASLAEIMRDRDGWPEVHQWLTIAPGGLGREIRGSNARWAAEFGFRPRSRPRWRRWTPDEIATAVTELAAPTRIYPTQKQFEDSGYAGLHRIISTGEGHLRCAKRLGLRCSVRTAAHCRPS